MLPSVSRLVYFPGASHRHPACLRQRRRECCTAGHAAEWLLSVWRRSDGEKPAEMACERRTHMMMRAAGA